MPSPHPKYSISRIGETLTCAKCVHAEMDDPTEPMCHRHSQRVALSWSCDSFQRARCRACGRRLETGQRTNCRGCQMALGDPIT